MAGECQTKNVNDSSEDPEDDKPAAVLDEGDIQLLKSYGMGPYTTAIKATEKVS